MEKHSPDLNLQESNITISLLLERQVHIMIMMFFYPSVQLLTYSMVCLSHGRFRSWIKEGAFLKRPSSAPACMGGVNTFD